MTETSQHTPDWTAYIERCKSLSKDEMSIREQVIREYLYDYSWRKACLRCGFRPEFAADNAARFSEDPYCIYRVKALQREMGLEERPEVKAKLLEQDKVDIISALKKEANYYGPGSSQAARVSALGKLAHLMGMEPAKAPAVAVTAKGVMVVPGIADTASWEQIAKEQQEKLQSDTMNAIQTGVNNDNGAT